MRAWIGAALAAPLLAVAMLAAVPAPADAAKAVPAALSEQDRSDLARIEAYLNSVRALSARFLQVNEDGGLLRGGFFMERPGKLRFQYDPPASIVMVSDGSLVLYYDRSVKQSTYVPLSTTPLSILTADRVALGGDVTVTRIERSPGAIRVTLQDTGSPAKGSLTLVFSDRPLQLQQWVVVDAQHVTTKISLDSLQTDPQLSGDLFSFREFILPGGKQN